jgi:hypothetical protein
VPLIPALEFVELLRRIFRTAARLDLFQAELLPTVGRFTDMLRLVGHGTGTILRSGLQKTQKDHRSWGEGMAKRNALAGFFTPLKIRLFDEEGLATIPSRNFDGVNSGDGALGRQ